MEKTKILAKRKFSETLCCHILLQLLTLDNMAALWLLQVSRRTCLLVFPNAASVRAGIVRLNMENVFGLFLEF